MSEALRGYEAAGGTRRRRRRRSFRGFKGLGNFVLLCVVVAGAFLWITRDSYSARRMIPAGQAYNIALADLINNSSSIAGSSILWSLLPGEKAAEASQALGGNSDLPPWVMNNLIGRTCYLIGNDLTNQQDYLFISKMSRVGRLLSWADRFVPGIEHDRAGGLQLRHLAKGGLYYAIRGRNLIASPSREALIHALTLTEDAMLSPDAMASLEAKPGGAEQVRGFVALPPDAPGGNIVHTVSFALRASEGEVHAQWRGVLSEAWAARMAPLLSGASPQTLLPPPPGMLGISANFGKQANDVAAALGQITGKPLLPEPPAEGAPVTAWTRNASQLQGLLGLLGPGIRVSCHGVDLNELVPVPELVAAFDAEPAIVEGLLAQLQAPPDAKPWDSYPRYDAQTRQVRVPMFGGPSIEPTFGVYGNSLLASSSATVAAELLGQAPNAQPLPARGNLFIRIEPLPCVQAIADAGQLLCEENLLKGYTSETFSEASKQWLERAGAIQEATLNLAAENGEISGELLIKSNASIPPAAPAAAG